MVGREIMRKFIPLLYFYTSRFVPTVALPSLELQFVEELLEFCQLCVHPLDLIPTRFYDSNTLKSL